VRPLNLGETLDASIKIVRARWRALATVMLVIAVPIQVATVLITVTTIDDYEAGSGFLATPSHTGDASDDGAFLVGSTAILALTFLGYLLGTVACYRAIADTYLGRQTGAAESLRFAGERLGATLWLTIVLGVGLVLGFLALIVPGIWLAVAWSVAYPAMLVEGTGGFAALRRSAKLVEGRWWATCGRLVVAYVLIIIIGGVVTSVLLAPVDDTTTAALLLEAVANLVVSVFTTPFLAAVATLIYFDLRVRKEGWTGGGAVEPAVAATPAPRSPARDAFGNPVAPRPDARPAPPLPGDRGPDDATPEGWAPPVAPEPRPRPLWDPGPDA
jgi:Membrane domain of glycerophosphoryl diester phosphodiesterase